MKLNLHPWALVPYILQHRVIMLFSMQIHTLWTCMYTSDIMFACTSIDTCQPDRPEGNDHKCKLIITISSRTSPRERVREGKSYTESIHTTRLHLLPTTSIRFYAMIHTTFVVAIHLLLITILLSAAVMLSQGTGEEGRGTRVLPLHTHFMKLDKFSKNMYNFKVVWCDNKLLSKVQRRHTHNANANHNRITHSNDVLRLIWYCCKAGNHRHRQTVLRQRYNLVKSRNNKRIYRLLLECAPDSVYQSIVFWNVIEQYISPLAQYINFLIEIAFLLSENPHNLNLVLYEHRNSVESHSM